MPGVKKLIVNADDFGLSRGVNRGIMTCYHSGIVRSASLMANGRAFDDAVAAARDVPGLGVGAHLNVVRGRPIAKADFIPHIVREGRFFLTGAVLALRCSRTMLAEIETEYRAQIEKILQANVKITHLDGEKHHHCFPPLFERVLRLAEEYAIPAVRLAKETPRLSAGIKVFQTLPLWACAGFNQRQLRRSAARSADFQQGIHLTGRMNREQVRDILRTLPPGVTELCCHPGYVDESHQQDIQDQGRFYIDATREAELRVLTDEAIQQEVTRLNIQLINYAGLN
ncbi:MAG: ChbG/HpnK family deacetylase [Candidatus Omnitrophica bacterium]|nr:ChbG/HpnK family deacetylase [Candidatus Omnitrophota bacterium]